MRVCLQPVHLSFSRDRFSGEVCRATDFGQNHSFSAFVGIFSAFTTFRNPVAGGVFLLEVQYSILKSLISTCVLSYVGSREDWLLDRICESKKDCWDSIRRTSYPYQ